MKKWYKDLILIGTIFVLGIASYLAFRFTSKSSNLTAYVYYQNDLVLTIDLSVLPEEITTYEVEGYNGNITIAAKHNAVAVIKENSPYHLCSQQGFISSTNQSLICLPNKVYIKLLGNTNSGVDVEI